VAATYPRYQQQKNKKHISHPIIQAVNHQIHKRNAIASLSCILSGLQIIINGLISQRKIAVIGQSKIIAEILLSYSRFASGEDGRFASCQVDNKFKVNISFLIFAVKNKNWTCGCTLVSEGGSSFVETYYGQ